VFSLTPLSAAGPLGKGETRQRLQQFVSLLDWVQRGIDGSLAQRAQGWGEGERQVAREMTDIF